MAKYVFNPLTSNLDVVLNEASEIDYDNTTSGLTAADVQDAIDEVQANINALPTPLTYKGTWSAATNTPTLANSDTGRTGWLYQVNAAGSVDFGAGSISFDIGDKVVNNGTVYEKWDMTDAVSSVNGATGAVSLTTTDIPEGTNEYFTNLKAQSSITGGASTIVTSDLTADRALLSSGSGKVAVSATTATELSYVSGVTSAIQTQINSKQATITVLPIANGGTNSSTTLNNNRIIVSSGGAIVEKSAIAANRALQSDANGLPTQSTTTSTQLGFLQNVTSDVQAQIAAKNNLRSFISNYDATTNTTGWATYADAAQATPVDGTGGSPTVTWLRSTTTPLTGVADFQFTKDAANRQGQGVSYDFTVDNASLAKVIQIDFDFIVRSGTFVAGGPGVDSDLEVYIYDVTNAVLIQPSSYKLFSNSSTTPGHFTANFQTASNSTSYRLILHCATTSASAYVVSFDNFYVWPSNYVYGTPITDWTLYTPTTNGFGNIASVAVYWRRVGDSIQLRGRFTTGTTTAAEARVNFPTGLVSASTISTVELAGTWGRGDTGAAYFTTLMEPSVSYVTFGFQTTGNDSITKQNGSAIVASGKVVTINASVPIAGWSSSVQTSDNADTRVTAAIMTGDPASATSGNPIIVPTVSYDSHAAYDTTTGRYTCPSQGVYKMYGALQSASAATTLTIYKNAVSTSLAGNLDSNGEATFASAVLCNAGDIIDIRPGGTVDATNMTLNIERLSGPSAIAATETIAARYYASATSISGSLATVSWTTKDYDTHSGMSSGTYTVPAAGKYRVTCKVAVSGTFALNNQTIIEIQKNGTATANVTEYAGGVVTAEHVEIVDDVPCVAGDTIRCQLSSGATGPAIVSSNTKNVFSIYRVGL